MVAVEHSTQEHSTMQNSAMEMENVNSSPKVSQSARPRKNYSRVVLPILSVFTIASLAIACAALAIAIHDRHVVPSITPYVNSIERVYNSSAFAIAQGNLSTPCIENLDSVYITGQTFKPGECISVTDSLSLAIGMIAPNCFPFRYTTSNCTGPTKDITTASTFSTGCSGAVLVRTVAEFTFNSFQILCPFHIYNKA